MRLPLSSVLSPLPRRGERKKKSALEVLLNKEQSRPFNSRAFMLLKIFKGPELQIQLRFADGVRLADRLQFHQVHAFVLGAEVLREIQQPHIG